MRTLEIERFGFGNDSTIGALSLDGDFQCFVLEDERRDTKVYAETTIPEGSYEITLRDEGGKHQDYLDRFPELHRGMLWLQNVPGFDWIYIHIGNREKHTLGCLLTGTVPVMLPDGEFEVARSTDAYLALYRSLLPSFVDDERVIIHIRDREPKP